MQPRLNKTQTFVVLQLYIELRLLEAGRVNLKLLNIELSEPQTKVCQHRNNCLIDGFWTCKVQSTSSIRIFHN